MDNHLTDSKIISFDDASLAWPTNELDSDESDRFVLRKINVAFPAGELSIISGATGSGK